MSDWQPIDTAPKDGTMFLIGWDIWDGSKESEWEPLVAYSEDGYFYDACNNHRIGKATHWMILPPLPK